MKTEKQVFWRLGRQWLLAAGVLLAGLSSLSSCKEEYDLDERTPDGWGASIYSWLDDEGNFTNMVRLINDLNYRDVLARTGSMTLFAANDDAFNRFYQKNDWGVNSYEQLTLSQKKLLLNGCLLKNSMQLGSLGNMPSLTDGEPREGLSLRHATMSSPYDSVPVLQPDQMPSNPYWAPYKNAGKPIVCMEDNSDVYIVHFIEKLLTNDRITNDDYDFLHNGLTKRQSGDASVNGVTIDQPNIRCSNGFIHRTSEVIFQLPNMAELIANMPNTTIYNKLLERFCAPYPEKKPDENNSITMTYNRLYGANVDTVYQKRFFSEKSQGGVPNVLLPSGSPVPAKLKFDPEWNAYYAGDADVDSKADQAKKDMAVMMVPTDEAMTKYWNEGAGKVLKDNYGTWDNVPDEVVSKLINVNMLNSLINSVPSKFISILNDANDPMGVERDSIESVRMGCNGAIYLTKNVYSPTEYVSVLAPALIDETMKIMYWAIHKDQLQYDAYLNSLNSYYSFFIPTRNALLTYIDPLSYIKDPGQEQYIQFHYDESRPDANKVWAEVVSAATGTVIREITDRGIILNYLKDILESHIVTGNVEDGHKYYRAKNGSEILVEGVDGGAGVMTVAGSYQINETQTPITISKIYDQTNGGNGKTYVLDGEPIMGTRQTVHDILMAHTEFSKFNELMEKSGLYENIHFYRVDDKGKPKSGFLCGGSNVSVFNTYHYTVYVPTNESIQKLQDEHKLPTWEQVEQWEEEGNITKKTQDSLAIMNFLKYHIQDNALFIGAAPESGEYETATINPATEKFYRVDATLTDDGIELIDRAGNHRKVLTSDPTLFNQVAREWQFSVGYAGGASWDKSAVNHIETTSSAVVHLIDEPLMLK
jgi:uncharacterized surface protein with fasciclin (FAS1) repeats